ncbi:GbsR/MarR family transcriptional regulator [Virgibacillus dakarensis]|uniref:HTH-type transcriptional regulator n=1 Tax=Lentibacillus populi TaxID=1827502 RepID=A0A9W5TWG4_9BACI|nr:MULTISPECIES: GbsR/MarR family transcriptional regulator [Bacillaceae]MBT2217269.1 GbsR/MarR family transcriptional regulator [Virgibacillus dakarensis]MTW86203.1 GbsR/MarR family transcriptional regulator [Virgibacillus dakarensis]GGB38451.1 putative HTH-type transcriptional regulator YvaV [Lentibacillus populi]
MDNHQDKIMDVKTQFIDKIADNMNSFGVSTSVGRVLGIIYMQRAPMTLDELSAETGMSKTRMSQVVREMIDLNIAERVFRKGVRKDLYQVEQDYYQTFVSLFTATWHKAINKSKHFEKKLQTKLMYLQDKRDLTEEEEQEVNEILAEIREWMDYYDWIRRLTAFFESGEIFNHVPKNNQGGNLHEQ